MKNSFWKNKSVLITGHTGFKGSWLTLILKSLNSKIYGYALDPISKPNFFDDFNLGNYLEEDFRCNILNFRVLFKVVKKIQPQILFHLAAQSSVLESYKNPLSTVLANVMGTANILEICNRVKSLQSVIIVTTDKVYENFETGTSFKEDSKLGGYDVYSSSKAACELLYQGYTKSFFRNRNCNIASVRCGNCIGGGDWTKDRIIKDCVESFSKNKVLNIRNPEAIRPWQHVVEPLFGYVKLAEKLYFKKNKKFVGSWNFGPSKKGLKVIDIAKIGRKIFKSRSKIIIKKSKKFYESKLLFLNSKKAEKNLKWKTLYSNKYALKLTFDWYKQFYNVKKKKYLVNFTFDQIENYKRLY